MYHSGNSSIVNIDGLIDNCEEAFAGQLPDAFYRLLNCFDPIKEGVALGGLWIKLLTLMRFSAEELNKTETASSKVLNL